MKIPAPSRPRFHLPCIPAALLLATACGGGGGGGSASLAAPSGLVYPTNPVVTTVGNALAPDTPSNAGGAVASYAVQPALPAGLALDPDTGVIQGIPTTATAAANYTVTATNAAGSTTAKVILTVKVPPIASFSVGPDQTLTYPNDHASPPYLVDLPDEHTTFIPLGTAADGYLVFAASRINTVPTGGGAVVLHTTDLSTFQYATSLGYNNQPVMTAPVPFTQCQPAYATEFDENYAAPGAVVQDPTLPAGNLIMLFEAENHCPGGVNQTPYYATVGFARSADNGKTWPGPENGTLGGANRYPVLTPPNPQPSTSTTIALGNAIPSGFVDTLDPAGPYLYVVYVYNAGGLTPASDGRLRVARAKLGSTAPTFTKWYQGTFSQPGIGGLDSGVVTVPGCTGFQAMGQISYNDDLGAYLLTFFARCGATGAWYYATATSLALQDWSQPQVIAGSQGPFITPCSGSTSGGSFDGFYPSFMSPGAAAGHTKLTGKAFFLNGCDQGARTFAGRDFTIALGAPAAASSPTAGALRALLRRVWREVGAKPSRMVYPLVGRLAR